jgi:Fe2+ or Zn2+ uptake regulation protein
MTTKRELIEAKAIELLKSTPQGIRTYQLINAIKENLPDIHPKTIYGTVWKLPALRPEEVYKQSRGFFGMCLFE